MAGPLRDVGQLSERSSSRRVCSWLRTNAGGVLNTCKWSDEPGLALGQSRERVSNTWVTCLDDRDNPRKLGLIPDVPARGKEASASASRWARGPLASW